MSTSDARSTASGLDPEAIHNFVAHLSNIWMVANILRAEELDEELDGEKCITASRLIQAIEDDPHDPDIPTETRNSTSIW